MNGLLKKIYDNDTNWTLLIQPDDTTSAQFYTVWDKKFVGQDSKEHPAVCDVHAWIGKRVTFETTPGKLKDPDGAEDGERWNATITAIELEGAEKSSDTPPVGLDAKPVETSVEPPGDHLALLTMKMLNAIGEWATAVEKMTKEA